MSQGSLSEVGTVLPCVDIERSKGFYRDVLGLEVEETPEMPGNVVVRVGETSKLFLYQRDAPNKADHTQATFLTDEFDDAVVGLRSKGVKFEDYDQPGLKTVNGVATMGDFKSAWFKDPDGNILCVSTHPEVVRKAA